MFLTTEHRIISPHPAQNKFIRSLGTGSVFHRCRAAAGICKAGRFEGAGLIMEPGKEVVTGHSDEKTTGVRYGQERFYE